VERTVGDYFISDTDDAFAAADDSVLRPVVVPVATPVRLPPPQASVEAPPTAAPPAGGAFTAPEQAPATPEATPALLSPSSAPRGESRGQQLARILDDLIGEDSSIHAAALVSLDGLTMASALPPGMEADRVGAMSAAILGLGERAAAELGRGQLAEVIIESAGGYVVLLAAGSYAVLTAIADREAKVGLVQYEMRFAARRVADVLG
jgi:hypothetical protein